MDDLFLRFPAYKEFQGKLINITFQKKLRMIVYVKIEN